jgi:hypothetical protein
MASHSTHGLVTAQQILRGDFANRQNDPRLHQFDLPLQVLTTLGRFPGLGVPIMRGPTLEDIRNKHTVPALPDRAQHLVEQFARSPDKGLATPILFCARGLTDYQPVRVRIADTENRVGTTLR